VEHPLPAAPAQLEQRWPKAAEGLTRYAQIAATVGVERGLIGPREVPRLWERHILNCAVVEELIPHNSRVVDVGSGAGLPGLVLALARPDLSVVLVEPLLRRATFLTETVATLGLGDRVQVHRSRAETAAGVVQGDVVTSRAVASLETLTAWSLPLVPVGGFMLALKGTTADTELSAARSAITLAGGDAGEVLLCGAGVVDPVTTVVRVNRIADPTPARRRQSRLVSRPSRR
jgi:16S rRNA (guanine527-N7)-methyltransferase